MCAPSCSYAPNNTAIDETKIRGAADNAQQCKALRHQSGAVHEVAQQKAVDADTESRPKQERPVVDRDEGLAGDVERRSICAYRRGQVVAQSQDRQELMAPRPMMVDSTMRDPT
jgi:hypothetical protein